MDAIVIIIILLIVLFSSKKFGKFVYAFAIIDILLRIFTFIRLNINIPDFNRFISMYFPSDIPGIINKYTNGVLSDVLMWGYVIMFIVFEFYIMRAFFRNKKL